MHCKKGEIVRDAYDRKTKSGKVVHVNAACIKDKGRPGKGPKTLPRPDDKLHLRDYGYHTRLTSKDRHQALQKAIIANDVDVVLHRLVLEMNIQSTGSASKNVMHDDVAYLKRVREKLIKKGVVSRSSWKTKFENRVQKGGDHMNFNRECSDNSCRIAVDLHEAHNVNGVDVVFRTLVKADAQIIADFDNDTVDSAQKFLHENVNTVVGVIIDGVLQGYMAFKELTRDTITLTKFKTNKGYRTTLLDYMTSVFVQEDYVKIVANVRYDKANVADEFNFWYRHEYIADKIDIDGLSATFSKTL